MDKKDFSEKSSGSLQLISKEGTDSWAFIPDPLPPDITIDNNIYLLLSEADRAVGLLHGLGHTLKNPHILINPFIRREAVLSSRIEGTVSGLDDLYAYEAGDKKFHNGSSKQKSDVQEVANYVKAITYGMDALKKIPVSLRLIKDTHRILLSGVRGRKENPGEFRREQNWIGPPNCSSADATFVPPPVPEMHNSLDSFEKYLHADAKYPPLIRLAVIHYQFETIHPFRDGNGRIGRLLIPLLLAEWGILPSPLLYISAFFEKHREVYYDLLFEVSARGQWEKWINFFLKGVAEQALDGVSRAGKLLKLQDKWFEQITQIQTSTMLLKTVDLLFESPFTTISNAQKKLNVSYNTAKRHIERLAKEGILVQIYETSYGKLFAATEIIDIVWE